MGAALVLQDKHACAKAGAIAEKAKVFELGGSKLFQELFIARMNLKSGKISR